MSGAIRAMLILLFAFSPSFYSPRQIYLKIISNHYSLDSVSDVLINEYESLYRSFKNSKIVVVLLFRNLCERQQN